MKDLRALLGMFGRPRGVRCRIGAHLWSVMTDPPSCLRCHLTSTWA